MLESVIVLTDGTIQKEITLKKKGYPIGQPL